MTEEDLVQFLECEDVKITTRSGIREALRRCGLVWQDELATTAPNDAKALQGLAAAFPKASLEARRALVEQLTSEVRLDEGGIELVIRPELRRMVAALAKPVVSVAFDQERDAHGRFVNGPRRTTDGADVWAMLDSNLYRAPAARTSKSLATSYKQTGGQAPLKRETVSRRSPPLRRDPRLFDASGWRHVELTPIAEQFSYASSFCASVVAGIGATLARAAGLERGREVECLRPVASVAEAAEQLVAIVARRLAR